MTDDMIPGYCNDPDRDTSLVMACGWLDWWTGSNGGSLIAGRLFPDTDIDAAESTLTACVELIAAIEACTADPQDYAYTRGAIKGAGVSWQEGQEAERDMLTADLHTTAARLASGVTA